jgi:hypothetical protein
MDCVLHASGIGQLIREKRHIFLSKSLYKKFKSYAYSQLHKINSKEPIGKRKNIVDLYGWDTKFGLNLVRLAGECEQLLLRGELDLRENKEYLKAIKRGEISKEDVFQWFKEKEPYLERLYEKSSLPEEANLKEIKTLLLSCLEQHYGNLSDSIILDKATITLEKIRKIVNEQ